MRILAVPLALGVVLSTVSCTQRDETDLATFPTAITDPSDPGLAGTARTTALSCYVLAGSVTSTSFSSLQGSASLSCTPGSSSLYIVGTMERSGSANGPWSSWSGNSANGSGTYVATLVGASRVCGYYYRMKAYGQWYDFGYKSSTTYGFATFVYC